MTGTMSGVQQGLVMQAMPSSTIPRMFRRSSLPFVELAFARLVVISKLVSSMEKGLSKRTADLACDAQPHPDCTLVGTLHSFFELSLAQQVSCLVSNCMLHTSKRLI
jgi:hypothetical protein